MLENEAIGTLELEAAQTDWMSDVSGGFGALIRRLVAAVVSQRRVARRLDVGRRRWLTRRRRTCRTGMSTVGSDVVWGLFKFDGARHGLSLRAKRL
jgi:hypothetical protein